MNTTVINMNTLHLNSVRLNGIGKVQSVSLSAGESTEEPIYPPVEPPVEPTPTFTLSVSVINGQVSATKNGAAISLPYVANEGDVIVLSVTPNDGYEFNGWADGNTDNPRTITMTADVALSAQCVEVVQPPVGNYIQFEDKAVEAICVANWSSDGIGLTEEDAAAVTKIGNAFYGNETIEYFNEFEYFTGITHLVNPNATATIKESFYGCKNLKEIRLPSSLTTIYDGSDSYKNGAFYGCSSLVSVGDMSHITRIGRMAFRDCSSFSQEINAPSVEGLIGYYAFYGTAIKKVSNLGNATILEGVSSASINSPVGAFARCTSLEEVRLPATTEQIQKGSFGFCTVLKTIVCEATTPPSLDANAWYGSNALTAIYVPDASLEAYKTAVNWSAYADRIHPLSEIEGSPYIQFEDAEVERVLMSKGVSSDGVGITMEDAAKVTNMQGWFKNNTAIRTFNELQYFTGLTTLSQDIFFGSSLEEIMFPATMTAFGNYCFYQLAGMDSLEIPATITTIGTYLLSDSSIVKVIMRATTPPAIAGYTFRFHRGAVSIYVPDASLEAYKTATNWVDMAAYIHPLSEIEGSLVFYDKLVGDGTAYINTEYYAKGTDSFAWDAEMPTSWNQFIFGTKSSALNLGVLPINIQQTYYLVGSAGATAVSEENSQRVARTMQVLTIDGSLHRVLTDNGVQTKDFGVVGSYAEKTSSAPLLLFACQLNATNAAADRLYKGAIRSFSITDIDGNTIMSLKPCAWNGDAGMWDEVNGKFYGNASINGEFSVAND